MHGVWLWVLNVTGTHWPQPTSQWYNFWSGFGSDIGEVAIIGGLIQIYRKHNCHQTGCWRIGKHPVGDGTIVVCKKHHPGLPNGPITAEQILKAHDGRYL